MPDLNYDFFMKKENEEKSRDQSSDEELVRSYKDAAEADLFLFGDYDYSYVWLDSETNDVS